MDSDSRGRNRWLHGAAVLAGYVLLSVLATWPLVLHFNTHTCGSDWWGGRRTFCESRVFLWNLWWFRHAIIDLAQSPFDCPIIFYPNGANLWFHPLAPVHGAIGIVLQSLLSLAATRNVILLLDLVASGTFTYLLGRQVGLARSAAFLAGAVFAFSPAVMGHLFAGHFELVSTCWMPAVLWLFIRMIERSGAGRADAVSLGLMTVGAAYTSQYYLLFSAELLALAVLFHRREVFQSRQSKRLLIAGLVTLAGVAPLLWSFVGGSDKRPDLYVAAEFDLYSGDLASCITPSFMHPILAQPLRPVHERLNPTSEYLPHETTMYLGLVAVTLAALGFKRGRADWRPARFWLAVALVYWTLSLGAHLKVGGVNTGIPLPAWLLSKLPVVRVAHAPGRHVVTAMLGLAMLAGYGWQSISRPAPRVILAAVLAFEFTPLPMPLVSTDVSCVYERLKNEPGSFAVLEIPLQLRDATVFLGDPDSDQLLGQTVHGRPTVGGMVARLPSRSWDRIRAMPVVGTLLDARGPADWDRRLEFDRAEGPPFFARWKIRAIVVHRAVHDGPEQAYIERVFDGLRRELLADGNEILWLD